MNEVTVNKIKTNYSEDYTEKDLKLIPSFDVISQFTPKTDEVEVFIYNEQGLLEFANYDYKNYTVTFDYNTQENSVSTVNVNPEEDVLKAGYEQGNYSITYNFFRNQLSSSIDNPFYIKQISSDRTEIRIANNNIGNPELEELVNNFKNELEESTYFEDFQVNFGNNNIFIANNILIDSSNEIQYTVLIKLYEPLESQFDVKDTLWITLQTADEVSYQVNFAPKVTLPPPPPKLKGPNFNIPLKDVVNNSTEYQNFTSINNTILTSSYNELQNILNQKGITVNIDYSDFNEFVYFSSAEERVRNFYYKVGLIQTYQEEINELQNLGLQDPGSTSTSITSLESNIQDIIKNFDGYERYQYYFSGSSNIYPKTNSTAPYNLAGTGSVASLAWLEDQATNSGSEYDIENPDRLVNTLPSFVKDNTDNAPFFLFMDMIGQHFDNIWTYTKDVSNRFDADNRLNYGISKDIVADAIKSMGVNLYQNNFSSNDLYSALVGINASGSLLPPTGSEVIETYVTASSNITKLDDVNKETYKRIYHNLPYLLKKKGTVEGLRALINTYGIPDTILRISEFGGKDKNNSNDWDYFQNKFNYALYSSGSTQDDKAIIPFTASAEWGSYQDKPEAIFLKFKPGNILPSDDEYSVLFRNFPIELYLTLDYTGSAYSSGSYSGSIVSSSNDYATLTLWDGTSEVTHVDAPFYDGNWWGVLISREGVATNADVTLRTANSIYNGNDGFKIGYTASSAVTNDLTNWINQTSGTGLNIPMNSGNGVTSLGSNTYYGLTGSFQEVRFYNTSSISKATFHDYVMNPYSIEGLNYSSSADNLIFRAPLGSNLNTSTGSLTSIHPRVTGSNTTHSFDGNSNYYISSSNGNLAFIPQTEFIYYDQPAVGIKNRISEKIRLTDNIIPSGNTLTPYRTIQQRYPQSESYTRDVNYVEVAFSPQNEINDDINSSMGYFNIGEYIGDPRQVSQSINTYPDLDRLRDSYFDKYYKNYDWTDYIRLIKYFDNSLFKMIKDFTPAKSSLATGVVIKQHLLERNKQRPAQVEISQHDYSGSIESGFISGGNGGLMPPQNNFPTSKISSYKIYETLTSPPEGIVGDDYSNAKGIFESIPSLSNYYFKVKNKAIDKFNPVVITPFINFNYDGGTSNQYTASLISWVETQDEPTVLESQISGTLAYNPFFLGQHVPVQVQLPSVFAKKDKVYTLVLQSGSANLKVTGSLSVWAANDYLGSSNFITPLAASNPVDREDQSKFYYTNNSNTPDLFQAWNYSVGTQYGPQTLTQSDEKEFYNGELSGSTIIATDGDLNSTQVTETADLGSGFVAPYNEVYVEETPNQNINGWFNIQRDGNFTIGFIVYKNDSDGIDRSSFWGSLQPGNIIQVRQIGGSYSNGSINEFEVTSITPFFNLYVVSTIPQIKSGDWYNPSSGLQSWDVQIINDPSITNLQSSILGDEPLQNNAVDSRLSTVYQDIDYSTNYLIPVNFNLLSQGNAVKFPIPDSNYSQDSWKNGRYNGSRNSSLDFNL